MCPPTFFTVSYEINPWMDASVPVDPAAAMSQWTRLRDVFLDLGHAVELIDPLPGLPDMVYAANGATVADGVAYGARFAHEERAAEGPAYLARLAELGFEPHEAAETNEGEGDLLLAGDVLLAGTGLRTSRAAHAEASAVLGREVVTLELVDPRFYHLDTALTVLRGGAVDQLAPPAPGGAAGSVAQPGVDVAYLPSAFSAASRDRLLTLFPDALLATEDDAAVLGLNAVSDGEHVVLAAAATRLADALRERGYTPVPVDLPELLRGGGGAKCCTLVLRG